MQQVDSFSWAFFTGGIGLVVSVLGFLFWLWMLIDCLTKERDSTNRIVWTLVIIFLPCLGPLLYFLLRKGKGRR